MQPTEYLKYSIPVRVRLFLDDKDMDYIYILLSKNTGLSMDDVKKIYKVEAHFIKQYIIISGDPSDIAQLFYKMQLKSMGFESITYDSLRIPISSFISNFN